MQLMQLMQLLFLRVTLARVQHHWVFNSIPALPLPGAPAGQTCWCKQCAATEKPVPNTTPGTHTLGIVQPNQCGGDALGWAFVLTVLAGTGAYLGVGAVLTQRQTGHAGLIHEQQWRQIYVLANEGVALCLRGGRKGYSGVGGGVPDPGGHSYPPSGFER